MKAAASFFNNRRRLRHKENGQVMIPCVLIVTVVAVIIILALTNFFGLTLNETYGDGSKVTNIAPLIASIKLTGMSAFHQAVWANFPG